MQVYLATSKTENTELLFWMHGAHDLPTNSCDTFFSSFLNAQNLMFFVRTLPDVLLCAMETEI